MAIKIPPHIKREYENTKTSFAKLGVKHGIHAKQIQLYAAKHKWVKFNPDTVIDLTTTEAKELNEVVPMGEHDIIKNIKAVLGAYYRPIDDILIMAYVDSYLTCLELKRAISTQGRVMISEKTNGHYINPSVNLLQAEKNNLIKLGKELGINTASRIRLGMDIEKHEDKGKDDFWSMLENASIDIDV